MGAIFAITAPFFALVLTGYGAAKYKVLGESGVLGINRFVYFFSLPALLFRQAAMADFDRILDESLFLAAHTCAGLIIFTLTWIMARTMFGTRPEETAILSLGASYGNIGFMGIPLIVAILGEVNAVPLALMLMIDIAFFIPFATVIIEFSRSRNHTGNLDRTLVSSVLKNPLIIAILSGLLLAATGLELPDIIDRFTRLLGQAAAPAAMFALGTVLVGQPLSDGYKEVGLVSTLKLLVYPAVMWWTMQAFGISPDWQLAATLGAATPVAAGVFVIAQEYRILPVRTSTAVLVSTGVSLLTLTFLISRLS
jgi:malonate transporter and related proteins